MDEVVGTDGLRTGDVVDNFRVLVGRHIDIDGHVAAAALDSC